MFQCGNSHLAAGNGQIAQVDHNTFAIGSGDVNNAAGNSHTALVYRNTVAFGSGDIQGATGNVQAIDASHGIGGAIHRGRGAGYIQGATGKAEVTGRNDPGAAGGGSDAVTLDSQLAVNIDGFGFLRLGGQRIGGAGAALNGQVAPNFNSLIADNLVKAAAFADALVLAIQGTGAVQHDGQVHTGCDTALRAGVAVVLQDQAVVAGIIGIAVGNAVLNGGLGAALHVVAIGEDLALNHDEVAKRCKVIVTRGEVGGQTGILFGGRTHHVVQAALDADGGGI